MTSHSTDVLTSYIVAIAEGKSKEIDVNKLRDDLILIRGDIQTMEFFQNQIIDSISSNVVALQKTLDFNRREIKL